MCIRDSPYGAFAAAVLGFTDGEGVGTYGLEKSYQSTLAGVDGRTIDVYKRQAQPSASCSTCSALEPCTMAQ